MNATLPRTRVYTGHQHTISLSDIMTSYELGLVMIAGHTPGAPDPAVQWVHTSELIDPTPFLTPRTVLLTTGGQFTHEPSPEETHSYVARLIEAGVSALGFAVEILHDRIPLALITACEEQGLPLFRVPYDTPFIAITQQATRQLAAASFERERWSLETQRAISRAALRRLGLSAAIDELAARLGRWVTLSNARGILIHASAGAPTEQATAGWIIDAITETAARGTRANISREQAGLRVHLQTIGASSGVQGILVVESTTPLDHADHSALEQVSSLAALHFEQHRQLSSGRTQLKSAVLTLLLSGEVDTALKVSAAFQHRLPEADMLVFVFGDISSIPNERFEQLQAFASQLTEVLLGEHSGTLILLSPPKHRVRITDFCETLGLGAGHSQRHPLTEISRALAEAHAAYRFARIDHSERHVHSFETAMNEGITPLLRENRLARTRAHELLAPLSAHDSAQNERLTETLEVWLELHGHNSQAAAQLGVHRHTVANRIKLIGELLGRDLADPYDRAELLIALTLQ